MRSINVVCSTVLLLTLLVVDEPASAQPAPSQPAWTFGGTVGLGRTWDDEGQIGNGLLAGAFADRRVFGHTDLELSADVLRHERTGGHFQARGHTTLLSGCLVQRFGSRSANGYLLGGVTLGMHSGTAGFPDENLVTTSTSTHRGYIFGAGLAFRPGPHLQVGPIVRIVMLRAGSDADPASAIMGGLRVGF